MSEKKIVKRYKVEDVTVVWQPHMCIHSTKCFHGLPTVFNPGVRPWVNTSGASKADIIAQVKNCPSGALSIEGQPAAQKEESQSTRVTVTATGPYMIKGPVEVLNDKGELIIKKENVALCRCGLSKNKPFCDGNHRNNSEWLENKS